MAVFVQDTFSGESSNVFLTSHTGEVGATWTTGVDISTLSVDATTGNVYAASTAGRGNYASGIPASAEYDVSADITSGANTGITGRHQTDANTFYHARKTSTVWQLYRVTTGTFSLLGSYSDSSSGQYDKYNKSRI